MPVEDVHGDALEPFIGPEYTSTVSMKVEERSEQQKEEKDYEKPFEPPFVRTV
jgi:hypothetical protein